MSRALLLPLLIMGIVTIAAAAVYTQLVHDLFVVQTSAPPVGPRDYTEFLGLPHAIVGEVQIILDNEYVITAMNDPQKNGAIAIIEAESEVDTMRIEVYTLTSIAAFNQRCLNLPSSCSDDDYPIAETANLMHAQFYAEELRDLVGPQTERIGSHRYFYTAPECTNAPCPDAFYTTFVGDHLLRVYHAPDSVSFIQ